MDGHQLLVCVVEEGNFVSDVHANSMSTDGFSTVCFPDYELVVVLAAERCQVLFVVGERETLDQDLMHLQTVLHLQGIEVPDYYVSLNNIVHRRLRKAASPSVETYLKALVGFLTRSNVLACVGDDDNGDLVVVTSEELLCSANNVSDHDSGTKREDDVLIVWV